MLMVIQGFNAGCNNKYGMSGARDIFLRTSSDSEHKQLLPEVIVIALVFQTVIQWQNLLKNDFKSID